MKCKCSFKKDKIPPMTKTDWVWNIFIGLMCLSIVIGFIFMMIYDIPIHGH